MSIRASSLVLLTLLAVVSNAALVSSPTFPIVISSETDVVLNGILTTKHIIEIRMDNLNLEGTIQIDNRSFTITCDWPKWVYSYELTAKVPRTTIPHVNEVCPSLAPDLFNASQAAIVERVQATPFGIANRRLFIFGEILGIAAFVLATEALSVANAITTEYHNFYDNEFTPFRNLTMLFINQTALHLKSLDAFTDAQTEINTITTGKVKAVEQAIGELKDKNFEIAQTQQKLADDTKALFGQTIDIINDGKAATLALVNGENSAIRQSMSDLYDTVIRAINATLTDNQRTRGRIQAVQDSMDRSNALIWDAITKRRMQELMVKVFYRDLSLIKTGMQAMVGDNQQPPQNSGDFQLSDKRVLIEKIIVNLVRKQNTGGPDFPELTNYQISFFVDTDYALLNFGPGLTVETLIRRMGPAVCNRSYTAQDSNGNLLPELSSRNASNTTCRLWAEVRTRTCQARNQAYNWSQSNPSDPPLGQDAQLHPENCTSGLITGLTAREQVFSDYTLFQQWFSDTVCDAVLWTAGGQAREYQMAWVSLNSIAYIRQPTVTGACALDLLTQIALGGTPFTSMLGGIEIAMGTALTTNIGRAHDLVAGKLPAGLNCPGESMPYKPSRRDGAGNLISDGDTIVGECTHCYWIEASEELINIYSVAQFATEPQLLSCSYTAYQVEDGIVTDYLVDAGSIKTQKMTVSTPYQIPANGLWYGDFDDASKPLYDVPNRVASVDGSPHGRKLTVDCLNIEPTATVLKTYQQYVEKNGFWDPISCAMSPQNYEFQRGIAADGYPYCLVGTGIPINESVSAYFPAITERGPDAFVAQSTLCDTLKKWKVDKVARAGTFVLTKAPRLFYMSVILEVPSGYTKVVTNSFCPSFQLTATGGQGYQLALFNERPTAIVIVLTLRTNISSEAQFCNLDLVVTVPGAPASVKIVQIPQCVGLNITVQRQAVRPEDSQTVLATCPGSPITASSLLSAAVAYTGIPTDVISRIVYTETNTGYVDVQSTRSFLENLRAEAQSMALFGYSPGAGVFASIEARIQELRNFNGTLAQLSGFFTNPTNLNYTDFTNTQLGISEVVNATLQAKLAWAAGGGVRLNETQRIEQLEVNQVKITARFPEFEAREAEIAYNITQIPRTNRVEASFALGIDGFTDELIAIVRGPIGLVEKAGSFIGKTASEVFNSIADCIKGVLSSAFGIFTIIITVVIVAACAVAAYLLYHFCWKKPADKRKAEDDKFIDERLARIEQRLGLLPMIPPSGTTAAAAAAAAAGGRGSGSGGGGAAAALSVSTTAAATAAAAEAAKTRPLAGESVPLLALPRSTAITTTAAATTVRPTATVPVSGFLVSWGTVAEGDHSE